MIIIAEAIVEDKEGNVNQAGLYDFSVNLCTSQPSTWTILRAWSLAARQRQYRSPQPSQPMSASLCAAEACGSRVILCTAQLVRVHLPRMVSVD